MPFGFEKSDIAAKAESVRKTLTGDFAQVRRMVDAAELVIGVWPDKSQPGGVDTMLVKGERLLRDIAFGSQIRAVRWTAIPCICIEQAEALRQTCGESLALN